MKHYNGQNKLQVVANCQNRAHAVRLFAVLVVADSLVECRKLFPRQTAISIVVYLPYYILHFTILGSISQALLTRTPLQ
jgi:hypothetical protein